MKIEDQKQYHEYLLEWCSDIYSHWENMRPMFSRLFDIKSLEEWEESCRELKEKLQEDLKVDSADLHFQTAKNLYEQWELLYSESLTYREEVE
ncbi:hypothetical protein [Ectobacillus panaciterrae]|uniref:hypothetical protein n=1 Tax=Ectobacillus panaciterrae TaxID=363872 RepID=UPI00041F398F|nr:hypothetical protein [Ectobacillus panaciterrae]